jgi:hypothetical protein
MSVQVAIIMFVRRLPSRCTIYGPQFRFPGEDNMMLCVYKATCSFSLSIRTKCDTTIGIMWTCDSRFYDIQSQERIPVYHILGLGSTSFFDSNNRYGLKWQYGHPPGFYSFLLCILLSVETIELSDLKDETVFAKHDIIVFWNST